MNDSVTRGEIYKSEEVRCVLQLSLLPARSHCWERLELQQQHETIDEWSREEIESDSAPNINGRGCEWRLQRCSRIVTIALYMSR